jgi:AraC-like DNA-binding protein
MATLIRAASLSNYAEVARGLGLDPLQMLAEAGLEAGDLIDPDRRVAVDSVDWLLEASAERSGCATFGLRMAESRRLSDFGALSLLISHQANLRAVLETIARYRRLLNEALALHLERSGDLAIIREELAIPGRTPGRQACELAVGTMYRLIRSLLGERWRPVSVHLAHEPPADLSVHRRLFGLRVQFESEFNGLVCAAFDLDQANPGSDPAMARYAQQYVESLPQASGSMALETRQAISLLLPLGAASVERIAAGMGLSVRTLQRRLDLEDASFAELLNDVRRELALRHMANSANSLTRVAELLGYAQLSSFTRWFITQFGTSPTRWRASSIGGRPD